MKRFTSRLPAIVSIAVAASVALDAARPHYGGTLRVQISAAIRSLDPTAAASDAESAVRARVLPLVFETLTVPNPNGGLRPALATAWERDDRGVVWRFHVRPNVTLHDGSLLQPWQIVSALRTANPRWTLAIDGDVVVVQIDAPNPDLPWELANARNAIAVRTSDGLLSGTGPFRVDRLDSRRASLRAHEGCWSGRPFVDAVQIDLAVAAGDRVSNLELGRADIVQVEPADARRVAQRGLRTVATRPRATYAIVFEPQRAGADAEPIRRTVAAAIDREAVRTVLLQRHGEPASAVLPPWISGYAIPTVPPDRALSRAAIGALPIEQRTVTLRVDASDALAQPIADRIAVDVREHGLMMKVQAPVGLAPRPDARLLRIDFDATTPDRALAAALALLGPRIAVLAKVDPPRPSAAPIELVYRSEHALLERHIVVPVVHVSDVYGLVDRVEAWTGEPILANGAWNLANVWLRTDQPDRR